MGCLFDLDGTLLDSAPELARCLNDLRQEQGLPHLPLRDIQSAISSGVPSMLKVAFNVTPTDPQFDTLKQQFHHRYHAILGQATTFFPGIPELLTMLNAQKIPWGIVTNKATQFTLPLLAQFPLLKDCASIVCGDTLARAKPYPEPLWLACEQLTIQPNATFYIGDAITDIQASTAAGTTSILALYGYIPTHLDPFTWHANHIAPTANALRPIIQSYFNVT
jgi:phosphoglycolate phosphatase